MNKDKYLILPIENEYEIYAKNIYWPVFRWEVSMPMLPKDNINSFERLFLELAVCKSGLNFETVNKLGISELIYKRICKRLYDLHLIDKNNVLTDAGNRCVDNKSYYNETILTARAERRYFLQDTISGEIIPYLTDADFICRELPNEDIESLWELEPCGFKKPTTQDVINAIKLAYQYKESEKNTEKDNTQGEYNQDTRKLDNEINQKTDSRKEIIQSIRFISSDAPNINNVLFIRCHISVNPLFVTNNDLDSIWTVKSPFGDGCNDWLESRLRIKINENSILASKVLNATEEIRDKMRGKVAFRNDLKIDLFNDFPDITNYEKYNDLEKKIVLLELVNQSIKTATLDDLWRIRLANAIDGIMKYHLQRLSSFQKQKVANWVSEHKTDFKTQLILLLDKYNIVYEYRESNYIRNPNISADNMLRIANNINKSPYKKDISIFMLIAANCADDTCWDNLVKRDSTIYERIALVDFWRNKEAAHDYAVLKELTNQDYDIGMCLLRELVSAYFKEVKE